MINNVVYERSVSECVKMDYLQQKTPKKSYPKPHCPRFAPTPFKNRGHAAVVPCTQNEKSTPLCLCVVSLCVYCWVHFVTIAKLHGNLISGRPSKVLPWSWLKNLGLGLNKKVLFTSLTQSLPNATRHGIAVSNEVKIGQQMCSGPHGRRHNLLKRSLSPVTIADHHVYKI